MNEVANITKDELIDISNVTLVRFMYYANRMRIPEICAQLALPEDIVLRYLSTNIPKDEKLDHIIEYVNAKAFDQLTPMETLLGVIYGEITALNAEDKVEVKTRSRLIKNYLDISKNYALYLDMLRRVNSMNEAGSSINFQLNIIDNHGKLQSHNSPP